ncbi:MAG: hypothetical protein ACOYVF_09190 [Candidatus Zixiibacteriota bacterium]
MADKDKQNKSESRITDKERFRYIGFEVFPGTPKDLFKSASEKEQLVASIVKRRSEGDLLRHECTLTESRVSKKEKLILAVACAVILLSLFIPWYSVYTEVVEESSLTQSAMTDDSLAAVDSLAVDSLGQPLAAVTENALTGGTEPAPVAAEMPAPAATEQEGTKIVQQQSATEEIISGMQSRKRVHKEYERLTGIGAILALGSVGEHVFSSGFILILTAIIFIVYTLLCIGLPVFTLYNIFGQKGHEDDMALKLKKYLKWNWIPVLLFIAALILSFVGSDYGADTVGTFTSLGDSYGPGVFLDSLSFGIFTTISGFVMLAVKGVEI